MQARNGKRGVGAARQRAARLPGAVLMAVLMAGGAGCSNTPDYARPDVALPAGYQASSAPTLPVPLSRWWQAFGSAELNALEEAALTNNRDLQAAIARIAQATAQAGATESLMAPVLQAIAMTENRAPKGGGVNSQSSVAANAQATGSEETYEFGLQASYEVDLWGKNRALVSSARATALASIFDREVVAMTLTADVANAYFQYLALRDRLVVAKQNVDNMRQVLAIVAKRAEVGEGKELEVAQQRSALAQAETVVPVLELGRDQAFNRLALLVGRTAETLHLTGTTLTGLKAPVVAPGLPSDLLRRRPDIRRADAVLFGANDMIGNAKAQLWPSLNLTALGGVGSNVLAVALSPQGVLYALAANAAQTLFDDGKTANQIAYSEAHYREMAMAYEKAVLVALQDVNNALVETHWSAVQMEAQARSAEFARRSHEMARRAFQIGTSDYFSVLDSDRTRYAEEDKQVEAKLNQLNASIDLFKALGGGFDAADVPPLDQKAKAEASGTAATPAARPAS